MSQEQVLRQVRPVKDEKVQLHASLKKKVDYWVSQFPAERKQSAVISALRETQHYNEGYLTTELINAVADYLDLPRIWVYEVASFYSMFAIKPVGRHCIAVCTNLSCMLRGADKIVEHLETKLKIKMGESSPCGTYYLKREEECLAACSQAPMMQIDHCYHVDLTPSSIDKILKDLENQPS